MKSFIAHYMNKYPGGSVDSDGMTYLRAHDAKGNLRVVLCHAAGSLQDRSKICGAPDAHDLAPIPKDCRVYCDREDGVEQHDEGEDRSAIAARVAAQFGGRVPSVHEMGGDRFEKDHGAVDSFRAAAWLEAGKPEAVVKPKKGKK